MAFVTRADIFTSISPSFSLSLSFFLCVSVSQLHATAACLLLLRLDVVVNLKLGLVGLLCGSVLQLPDGDREKERERCWKLETEGVDVWDAAQTEGTFRK